MKKDDVAENMACLMACPYTKAKKVAKYGVSMVFSFPPEVKARLRQVLHQEQQRRQNVPGEAPPLWEEIARPQQRMPLGSWRIWLILAGRGFGKTRTGAETLRLWAASGYKHLCLLGHTREDVRRVMLEGPSGLAVLCGPQEATYFPGKGTLAWRNGACATSYSAEAPEKLRGPQFHGAWVDELAKFRDPEAVWDQLMFALRLGDLPRVIITTTPRPLPFLRQLMGRQDVVITTGSTYDNAANLPPGYLEAITSAYGHTRLGAQEIQGHLVAEGCEGLLWKPHFFHYVEEKTLPPLRRVVVALDPAVTSHGASDETGIIVAGRCEEGVGYVVEDLSGVYAPQQWCRLGLEAFYRHNADVLVAEVNNGGDLVRDLLRTMDPLVPFKGVRATRGKVARAQPIAALYEQQRIMHLRYFPMLETQLLQYSSYAVQGSPDRLDALVWALTELFLSQEATAPCPKVW